MAKIAYLTADWHIPEEPDAGAWSDLPIVGDAQFALSQIVDLCVADRVPLVAAGDIFDGPDVAPKALGNLYAILRRLREPVIYVIGNHDRGRNWLLPLGTQALHATSDPIMLKSGVSVSGLDWVEPARFSEAVARMPKTDVGIYHQTWAEWAPGSGRIPWSALPRHRLAVCGDIHVRSIVEPNDGPAMAVSPGPLTPQSTVEFIPHLTYALHDDFTVTSVQLRGRTFKHFTVTDEPTADRCAVELASLSPDPTLPDHLAKPLVAVRVTCAVDGFAATIKKLSVDRGFVLRYNDAGTSPKTKVQVKASDVGDVHQVIRNWNHVGDEAKSLAQALLAENCDKAAVLEAARAAFNTKQV